MKKTAILSAGIMFAFGTFAAQISPDEALARLQSSQLKISAKQDSNLKLAYTAKSEAGLNSAYIFTPESGPGFTILSADDRAVPVLGYSNTQKIDVDNMPPALVWWLSEQSAIVENSKPASSRQARSVNEEWTPIEPLIKTSWDQDSPYNSQCPTVGNSTAPTGCVATSMAQCMKYFNYPQSGVGSIEYQDNGKRRTMTFYQDFDWDNMLDTYTKGKYDETEAEAVAYLMKACGYSTEMIYGQYASGTQSYKIVIALITYFQYDKGTYFTYRSQYSADQWSEMIYDNLKNVGPIIYNGQSLTGGHSFICDGYDGNGYFHFNWGWSGLSDGYYVLDALNPSSQGIGGSEGGYNSLQSIVMGMQPPVEGKNKLIPAALNIYGTPTATINGNNLDISTIGEGRYNGFSNGVYRDIRINFGAIFENANTSETVAEVQGVMNYNGNEYEVLSLIPTGYYPSERYTPSVVLPELADGTYKVYPACKEVDVEDATWNKSVCDYGYANYFYLKVENGQKTISNVMPNVLTFSDVVIDSPLYLGRTSRLKSTVTNDSDLQLTTSFYPVLIRDGQIRYASDYMLVTVNPHETVDLTNYLNFMAVSNSSTGVGTYNLRLIESESDLNLGDFGEYNMEYSTGSLRVKLNEFFVDNAGQVTVEAGNQTFKDTYLVADMENTLIVLQYTVQSGYFDTPLRILGSKYDAEQNMYIPFDEDIYFDLPFVGQGTTKTLYLKNDFSDLEEHVVYYITAAYMNNNMPQTLGALTLEFDRVNSVDGISSEDTNAPDEYFNLQGVRILNPEKGQLLIHRKGSKTTKIIY